MVHKCPINCPLRIGNVSSFCTRFLFFLLVSEEDVPKDRPRDGIVETCLLDIFEPDLTMMLDELAPPDKQKQKMIFTQTSDDDPNLKIVAVGDGPIKMVTNIWYIRVHTCTYMYI